MVLRLSLSEMCTSCNAAAGSSSSPDPVTRDLEASLGVFGDAVEHLFGELDAGVGPAIGVQLHVGQR
jgi:hypothetical protein